LSKKIRYLITTADERTWKFDRPVIFLGEWCKTYNRSKIWQQMDSLTMAPVGKDEIDKDALYANAREIEKQLFPIFVNMLNKYHGLSYSDRAWKILIGPWLRRNIDVIYNRFITIEKCLQTCSISGLAVIKRFSPLAPANALGSLINYSQDDWNASIYVRILELSKLKNLQIEFLFIQDKIEPTLKIASPPISILKRILKALAFKLGKFTKIFCQKNDALIISTYMSIFQQIKLQIALGQFPQFWIIPKINFSNKIDSLLRKKLILESFNKIEDERIRILTTLIIETMPSCYLEEFSVLLYAVEQLRFPMNPRFIFTSNNFEANEIFQLWVALKIEAGSKYFVGQHGNNYGTHKLMVETIEEVTSDRFLTWGWKAGLNQHTPAFNFKISGIRKAVKNNPKGGLLLVENLLGHRVYVWDRAYDFNIYLKEQMNFVNCLSNKIKSALTVRLHYTHSSFNACELERWHDFDPSINIDDGYTPYNKLINRSRLVIYGYDSTGILESLALNLPTLILMENKFNFLRNEALPYYKMLQDAGILHISPKTAAKKVNEVWDNVEDWWASENVQKARRIFCDQYSRFSLNPVAELVEFFQKVA